MLLSKTCPKIDFLIGHIIIIRLSSGAMIKGVLKGHDQFLNLVVDEANFLLNKKRKKLGKTLIRGNCILEIKTNG